MPQGEGHIRNKREKRAEDRRLGKIPDWDGPRTPHHLRKHVQLQDPNSLWSERKRLLEAPPSRQMVAMQALQAIEWHRQQNIRAEREEQRRRAELERRQGVVEQIAPPELPAGEVEGANEPTPEDPLEELGVAGEGAEAAPAQQELALAEGASEADGVINADVHLRETEEEGATAQVTPPSPSLIGTPSCVAKFQYAGTLR